mgnify:CR=1 FL=1
MHGHARGRIDLETMSAKEDKGRVGCCGNHLGCLSKGRRGIAVRTKWQFGPGYGDIPAWLLNGNGQSGDAW